MTLVLGAGVSLSCGVPSWRDLVARVWAKALPRRPAPEWLCMDEAASDRHERARALLVAEFGEGAASGFELGPRADHPQAFQIVLEEIEHALRPGRAARAKRKGSLDSNPIVEARKSLTRQLTAALYRDVRAPRASDSVGVIAACVRREQKRDRCRIRRVITFNADDLLEIAANRGHNPGSSPVVWPVSRASYHPRHGKCAHGKPPLTVYHVHGFLPRPDSRRSLGKRGAPDTLVFTDAQYWNSVSNPSSFANRVVSNALQDSHCIFIGLSMTDVNLMRWLGSRFCEVEQDKCSEQLAHGKPALDAVLAVRRTLQRDYWIRTPDADPSHFISAHLERRGVSAVELASWGDLSPLLQECFPA